MDQNKIIEALRATLEPTLRERAEAYLTEVQKIISFVPQLLHIIMNPEIDINIKQSAAIYMKNMITQHWEEEEVKPGQPVPFSIHENDKQIIRDNIVEAVIAQKDPVRVQLAVCVSTMVKNDYPGRWPAIAGKVIGYLTSPNHETYLGSLICLYQLVKHFEYKKNEEKNALNEVMVVALPIMHRLCMQLLPDPSENSVFLQKQILKIFFATVQFQLNMELVNQQVFAQWMDLLKKIIELPVPEACDSVDEGERGDLVWWKCKKWAVSILNRTFERYGSPGTVLKDYEEFAKWYLKSFGVDNVQLLLMILDRYVQKQFVSQRVLQLTLQYITTSIKHGSTWKCLKPHMQVLMKSVIFPLFGYTDEDQELWQEDPVEFIKIKYDIYEEFFSPTAAAEGLLVDVVSKRKQTLQMAMSMAISVINCEDPKTVDQALHMIGVLAEVLLKKKAFKSQVEDMMKIHVFKQFSSPHGYLRARACWMVAMFGGGKFKDVNNVHFMTNALINLLNKDPELPVRVEAAIGLQKLLADQTNAKEFLLPHIQQVFRDLLKLIRETEADNVSSCLQNFVYCFVDEVTPLAVELTTSLGQTFAAVIESPSSDDKSIAAMGLLNTLETICHVLEDQKEVLSAIEGIIIEVIGVILKNDVSEYFEEMMSLIYSLTSPQVTERMWSALPIIYDLFKRDDNIDYFTEMMPALHNFITVDSRAFLAESSRMEIIFDMAKMVLNGTLGDAGEDSESHAAKLLEIMLLQFKEIPELVCKMMPSFLDLVLSRLSRPIVTTELRTMCLQVILAALFVNPSFTLAYLSEVRLPNQDGTMVREFLLQLLKDAEFFMGLHDRKMFVLGVCTLMSLPNNLRPSNIDDLASKFLPSLIVVFKGLKKVYENLSQDEEDDEEHEGEDDVEELENEDEEDVLDEEDEEYRQHQEKHTQGDDDDDDDDDLDDYDETVLEGYDTTVDGEDNPVDEYQMFRAVIEGISNADGMWYQVLTSGLVEDDRKQLEDIFRLAEQRRAAQESKKIEQAGGYNFTVTQVPASFCFGANPSS